MGRPPKYTPEFCRDAVGYRVSSDKTYAEAAASLGVNESTLAHWVRDARSAEPSFDERHDEAAVLRARVRELEMENEFLKKPRPSPRRGRREREVRAHGRGEGLVPGAPDGAPVRRIGVGLLYSWASPHGPPNDPWGPLRAEVMRLWLAAGSVITPGRVSEILSQFRRQGEYRQNRKGGIIAQGQLAPVRQAGVAVAEGPPGSLRHLADQVFQHPQGAATHPHRQGAQVEDRQGADGEGLVAVSVLPRWEALPFHRNRTQRW